MRIAGSLLLLSICFFFYPVIVVLALPIPETIQPDNSAGVLSNSKPEVRKEIVPILKQINQVNDDGSYTFGYENGDGSFRVETKDVNGYIRGKYGYVDREGRLQTLEYEAGKSAGKSVGFIPSGGLSPYPVVRNVVRSPEQRALDFEYSSVDDDEDGMPDNMAARPAISNTPSSSQPQARSSPRIFITGSGRQEQQQQPPQLRRVSNFEPDDSDYYYQINQGFGSRIRV